MNKLLKTISSQSSADSSPTKNATHACQKIIIRDMEQMMYVGVYDNEKEARQKVVLNVEAQVPFTASSEDNLDEVVNYEILVTAIQTILADGHTNLLETIAVKIADFCLDELNALDARVYIQKPEIYDFNGTVGIEIYRKA